MSWGSVDGFENIPIDFQDNYQEFYNFLKMLHNCLNQMDLFLKGESNSRLTFEMLSKNPIMLDVVLGNSNDADIINAFISCYP